MSNHPADSTMPWLNDALDCEHVQSHLKSVLGYPLQVTKADLIRHKPGRRVLIEYHLKTTTQLAILLGKGRAKGLDHRSYTLQESLWEGGFGAKSIDGLSVPEPLGTIPDWHMWLQRKVPGRSATQVLPEKGGLALMSRIAALAHKLHTSGISTQKIHTLEDERRILHDRLSQLGQQCPHWQTQLEKILKQCDRIAAQIDSLSLPMTTIHRDYYADQILVDGDRLWLVDLDLACQGHVAVDIGNFVAHITEQSLRQYNNPNRLIEQEKALVTSYLAATQSSRNTSSASQGVDLRHLQVAITAYTTLSLVRHISISWQMSTRRPLTEALLDLCDDRCNETTALLGL